MQRDLRGLQTARRARGLTALLVLLGAFCLRGGGGASWAARAEAQAADIVDELVLRAREFQNKGRTDKAAAVWDKVLRARPEHADALESLGLFHANAGRTEAAKGLLARLERVAPGSPGATRLRAALLVGTDFDKLVSQAREQVRAGDLRHAVKLYEQAFGGASPPERLALEYYQTLGGTDAQGWERARVALEERARARPSDLRLQLAWAEHLTYREPTRRQGIDRLRELAAKPAARNDAVKAWRQALLWLNADASDATRIHAYLDEVASDDHQVRNKLVGGTRKSAGADRGQSLQAGFSALERADVAEASRHFERAGDTPEALVGLAVVALRKEDFELAESLLEKASARAPTRRDLWLKPLTSARFWARFKRAEKLASKDASAAVALLREAVALSAEEAHHARIALATLLEDQGRPDLAEQELNEALRQKPDEPGVLRALVALYLQRSRYEEAMEVNARLSAVAPDQAWAGDELKAELLRGRAKEQRRVGELTRARELLEEARQLSPSLYWVRFDLASVELELGELAAAREQTHRLLELDPNEPAGQVLRARLEAELGRIDEALDLLASVPPRFGGAQEVGLLRQELTLRREVDGVVRLAARSGTVIARREMQRLQRRTLDAPRLFGVVALGWAGLGEYQRAVSLLREAIAAEQPPPRALLLQLLSIYLQAGMDEEFRRLRADLESDPALPPRVQRDLDRLRIAHAVQSADKLANTGEHKRAFLQLEPLLVEFPDEPNLKSCLGRLFLSAGNYGDAAETFGEVLAQHPDHVEACEGAVSAALARSKVGAARALVAEGLKRNPGSARMHLIAARYELADHDDAAAMRELISARGLAEKAPVARPANALGPPPAGTRESTQLLRRARAQLGSHEASLTAAEGVAMVGIIDAEIERIRARHDVQLRVSPLVRYRAGEYGLNRLVELSLPMRFGVPLGYMARLEASAEVVYLNAGTAALDEPGLAARFGALGSLPGVTDPLDQSARGIAPRIAFALRDYLRLELGTSPLGFNERRLLGLASFRKQWGPFALGLRGERAPITDSLLSYAGTSDPLTGRSWGGVTRMGGTLDLAFDAKPILVYLQGSYYLLKGHRVQDNRMVRVVSGIEWLLHDWGTQNLRLGVNVLGMAYARDQYGFTLGRGGYFSPQRFLRVGVPVSWRSQTDATRFEFFCDPGVTWFRVESAPYYPGAARLQSSRVELGAEAHTPDRENLGFSLNAGGSLSYVFGRHVELGAEGSVHLANAYNEYRGLAFALFRFHRRARSEVSP